jgi:hypothetical protein
VPFFNIFENIKKNLKQIYPHPKYAYKAISAIINFLYSLCNDDNSVLKQAVSRDIFCVFTHRKENAGFQSNMCEPVVKHVQTSGSIF